MKKSISARARDRQPQWLSSAAGRALHDRHAHRHAGRTCRCSAATAGAGTLVRYGDDANNCDALRLQFDAGRGTQHAAVTGRRRDRRISTRSFSPTCTTTTPKASPTSFRCAGAIRAERARSSMWCAAPTPSRPARLHVISCKNFVAHIGDRIPALRRDCPARSRRTRTVSSKPDQRRSPTSSTFEPTNEPKVVWTVRRREGHRRSARPTFPATPAYRVDTPAGSVVIGGDAGNDKMAPPRDHVDLGSGRDCWRRASTSSCTRPCIR